MIRNVGMRWDQSSVARWWRCECSVGYRLGVLTTAVTHIRNIETSRWGRECSERSLDRRAR